MGSTARPDRNKGDGSHVTLGDLVYADRATPASEAEWVEIVRSISARDPHALHALYQRAHRIVFTLIMRIVNDGEAAEEVTLDVFHDIWRRAATYDVAGGTVVGWIMNQARSRAIDRLRFEQRKKRVSPPSNGAVPEPAAPDPEDVVDVRERSRRLVGALGVLTPDERRAIETAFFSDYTYADVAAQLDQPVGTVKTRIRSGLGKLRRALTTTERRR